MKKLFLLSFLPLLLIGCNNGSIRQATNPFNDSYVPFGMKGEYNEAITPLNETQFNSLKSNISVFKTNPTAYDKYVTSYTKEEQSRDLKYSYFNKELNPTDMCSFVNDISTNIKYSNRVSISKTSSDRRKQYSGGIDTILSTTQDYTFDPGYKTTYEDKYLVNNVKQIGNNDPVITADETKKDITESTFYLSPYTAILNSHFKDYVVRKKAEYKFEILGDSNNAVYGLINRNNESYYIVKEAKSVFVPYSTSAGREYKAVDNFFYECLFKEYTKSNETYLLLTNFRFYHEMLILSEACDEDNRVPVLYLEKPVLVEYNEFKYTLDYSTKDKYLDAIPGFKS